MLTGLTEGDTIVKNVNGVNPTDMQRIRDFLQDSVNSWCNVNGKKCFAARDLVGVGNADWSGTPLHELYDRYIWSGKDTDYAYDQAGKDLGHILKSVLNADPRTFKTDGAGDVRRYQLV